MGVKLESWMLAAVAERGAGEAIVVDGRAIVAGDLAIEPFRGAFPLLDHERFLDAKIALARLANAGYLRSAAPGVFVITEVGEQRAALERGMNDLDAWPAEG
mgnify:CR=1 FL=1|jgi:hypothetical protein